MPIKKIEQRPLTVGMFTNLFMAIAGWTAYYLSGMQATLLDGNFSFIAVLTCFATINIVKITQRTSKRFPQGKYFLLNRCTQYLKKH